MKSSRVISPFSIKSFATAFQKHETNHTANQQAAYRSTLSMAAGWAAPRHEDVKITRPLKGGGEILAIRVHDRVILGCDRYYSFSDGHL
jgi:RadC-like JAB domain